MIRTAGLDKLQDIPIQVTVVQHPVPGRVDAGRTKQTSRNRNSEQPNWAFTNTRRESLAHVSPGLRRTTCLPAGRRCVLNTAAPRLGLRKRLTVGAGDGLRTG